MISEKQKVICPGFRLRSLSYGGQVAKATGTQITNGAAKEVT
jgi:hypothetical protein